MKVSLDTDITIHLYMAGREDLLFKFFDKLYVHEFVLEHEIKNKSIEVYYKIKAEKDAGRIDVVTQKDLIALGMKKEFEDNLFSVKALFDFGEANAIALAITLGINALVTDDTKDFGPHETLVKELVEDVMPFAFYELLYLVYLQSEDDFERLRNDFEMINACAYPIYPMNFLRKIKCVVRRFNKYGSQRDCKWMKAFCERNRIDYRMKMQQLHVHLMELE